MLHEGSQAQCWMGGDGDQRDLSGALDINLGVPTRGKEACPLPCPIAGSKLLPIWLNLVILGWIGIQNHRRKP